MGDRPQTPAPPAIPFVRGKTRPGGRTENPRHDHPRDLLDQLRRARTRRTVRYLLVPECVKPESTPVALVILRFGPRFHSSGDVAIFVEHVTPVVFEQPGELKIIAPSKHRSLLAASIG